MSTKLLKEWLDKFSQSWTQSFRKWKCVHDKKKSWFIVNENVIGK